MTDSDVLTTFSGDMAPTSKETVSSGEETHKPSTEGESVKEATVKSAPKSPKTHRSNDSLSAWTKTLPKSVLMPLKWDEDIIEKKKKGLSAFAPPFFSSPVMVDDNGVLVGRSGGSGGSAVSDEATKAGDQSEDSRDNEKSGIAPKLVIPTVSAWTKGPPLSLKPVRVVDSTTPIQSATSSNLDVPMTAFSFNTESDLTTPWDPALPHETVSSTSISIMDHTQQYAHPDTPQDHQQYYEQHMPFMTPTYPWGMPMSPSPLNGHDRSKTHSTIPGGPGVIWTPAGWAVQDAAMKFALRTAEMKTLLPDAKNKKPKQYYKSESVSVVRI